MKIRFAFLLLLVGFIATVSSCTQRSLNSLVPCTINGVVQNVPVNPQRALDLLILIDDSPSMRDEQAKLAEQVPRLANLLLTGGQDTDGSTPVGEFPAVESLHVAVITPDLGYSTDPPYPDPPPYEVGTDFNPSPPCTVNGFAGLDGLMQTTGLIDDDDDAGTPRVECSAETPEPEGATPYLNRPPGAGSSFDAQFVEDVECITGQTDGCGFEQQLEALLRQDQNPGNLGFSREDALLAVIVITDEDDCSTTDPRVFDIEARASNPFQGPFTMANEVKFNLRCSAHAEALQEIQRYVEGIANLKQDPSQVVFAAITGIPEDTDLDRDNFQTDVERYDAILMDEDMQETVPTNPDGSEVDDRGVQLVPACTATDGSGSAAPARRIVETMRGLADGTSGVGTVVESICAADYSPALNAIVDRIAAALRQLCLPRPLNRDANDLVGCEVREVQPAGVSCDESRGRIALGIEEDGREVCRVAQLPSDGVGVPEGLGWYYDDFTENTLSACSFNPEPQRVSFTENAAPESGARIRFECLQAAPPKDVDIGWPCSIDADCEVDPAVLSERYDRDELELVCDPSSNTCQLTCESDVQCPGGYACYDATDDDVDDAYCVNPTCTLN